MGSIGIKTGFVRTHLEGYKGVSIKGYVRLRVLKLAASREQNGDVVKGVYIRISRVPSKGLYRDLPGLCRV